MKIHVRVEEIIFLTEVDINETITISKVHTVRQVSLFLGTTFKNLVVRCTFEHRRTEYSCQVSSTWPGRYLLIQW